MRSIIIYKMLQFISWEMILVQKKIDAVVRKERIPNTEFKDSVKKKKKKKVTTLTQKCAIFNVCKTNIFNYRDAKCDNNYAIFVELS